MTPAKCSSGLTIPVTFDRIDHFYSDTSRHFKTKQQDISQSVSPGDSPVWPVLCYGPARAHFDGAVSLGVLPVGSCGTESANANPGAVGAASCAWSTACCFFFELHQLKPSGSETTAYCKIFTFGLGIFFFVWFNP